MASDVCATIKEASGVFSVLLVCLLIVDWRRKMHSTYVRMQLERQRAEARQRRLQKHHSKAKAVRAKLADCCRKLTAFLFTQVMFESSIRFLLFMFFFFL